MARFLIEVAHDSKTFACAKAVEVFLTAGSHFLTHADWGCKDGEHKAWMIVEVDTHDDARAVIPPAFRTKARVVKLNLWSLSEINEILRHHDA